MEKNDLEMKFYDPQSKALVVHMAAEESISFPKDDLILFFDADAKVWRIKNLKHLS